MMRRPLTPIELGAALIGLILVLVFCGVLILVVPATTP